jgi:hypothetical protein
MIESLTVTQRFLLFEQFYSKLTGIATHNLINPGQAFLRL